MAFKRKQGINMTFDLPTTVYFLKFTYDKLCLKVINLGNYDFPALLVKEEFYLDLPREIDIRRISISRTFRLREFQFEFSALFQTDFQFEFPSLFQTYFLFEYIALFQTYFNQNYPHFLKHIFNLNFPHFLKHIFNLKFPRFLSSNNRSEILWNYDFPALL